MASAPPDLPKGKPFAALVGLIGLSAAAVLVPLVQQWEGTEYQAYQDLAKVWTICTGDTKDVAPGQVASPAECEARLERQLIAHAKPVLACVPALENRPNALAASSSLSYNIGPAAFCRSTAAKRFNAGQWKEGCDAFLSWRYAGGREIPGLLNRRKAERLICLKDAA